VIFFFSLKFIRRDNQILYIFNFVLILFLSFHCRYRLNIKLCNLFRSMIDEEISFFNKEKEKFNELLNKLRWTEDDLLKEVCLIEDFK
jgi:hypothetical protein